MQKLKIVRGIAAIVLLLQCFFSFAQIEPSELDSILTVADAYGPSTINAPAFKGYKFIAKPRYNFKYIPVRFIGIYSPESYSRYMYGIRFYDTTNKKVYILQQGKNIESGYREYSGVAFIVNGKQYYLPLDFRADDVISNLVDSNAVVPLQIEAWLIYRVNSNPVLPFLLVKNVKKI